MSAFDVALRPNPGKPYNVELAIATALATGEFFPVVLDGSTRLADVLRARRLRQRRQDEALLLLWTE